MIMIMMKREREEEKKTDDQNEFSNNQIRRSNPYVTFGLILLKITYLYLLILLTNFFFINIYKKKLILQKKGNFPFQNSTNY